MIRVLLLDLDWRWSSSAYGFDHDLHGASLNCGTVCAYVMIVGRRDSNCLINFVYDWYWKNMHAHTSATYSSASWLAT